jgi:hypothetical protein
MRKHLALLQEPDGLLAEVDITRPTLARQANVLVSENRALVVQLMGLRDQALHAAQAFGPTLTDATAHAVQGIADLNAIRNKAVQLLGSVHQHVAVETRLVQESLLTDIGVGD